MGTAGAGKTVLYDALANKIGHGYRPSERSRSHEPHRVVVRHERKKERVQFVIVPGQDSEEREEWLDKIYKGGRRPRAVIYAAAWGYNKVWSPGEEETLASQIELRGNTVDLEAVRTVHLQNELRDFSNLCGLLSEAWRYDLEPKEDKYRLIIAVTKADLYTDRLSEARRYYVPAVEPSGESGICAQLRALVGSIGDLRIRVTILPVSAFAETYVFRTDVRIEPKPTGKVENALLPNFDRIIGELAW